MPIPPPDSRISHADALSYWNSIPATINGMLGGLPQVSRTDLRGSANFLAKVRKSSSASSPTTLLERGVDCGAGIGRVTAGLLSKVCQVVDVVEPVEKFARQVETAELAGKGRVGEIYVTGLEAWIPAKKYDLIWNQWCLGHLTDTQLVDHLKRCKDAVNQGGWIVVKENMSTNPQGLDIFDEEDSSVTRTDASFRRVFEVSGLHIIRTELQAGFPKDLFPVRMYALQHGK